MVYDQAYNSSFYHKTKSVRCNAYSAVTATIKGTSRDKRFEELGLEPLQLCYRYTNLRTFYKFYKIEYPHHLFKLVPVRHSSYTTRYLFSKQNNFFKNSFSFSAVIEGNNLHHKTVFLKTVS